MSRAQEINLVQGFVAVTPSDSVDLADGVTVGLYVGVAGDVVVVMENGSTVTLKDLAAGVVHPLAVERVKSTGTVATDILAAY